MPMSAKFFKNCTALLAIAVLSACSSSTHKTSKKVSVKNTTTDTKIFGAKYDGRTYQQQFLMPVSSVENRSAVINQGDFLTQLSNVRQYSSRLTNKFAVSYGKITNWVLSGANVNELSSFGIQPMIMKGQDGYQNVLMTGYYSPVIHARRTPQGKYNQPIYAMPSPSQKRVSRAQIYAGALRGKGLELAYSDSMIDNFLLGVQGSGYVDFGNGDLNYFAYAGQNGLDYVAVGRLLVEDGEIAREKMSIQAIKDWAKANPSRLQALLERNPSYVYFKNDPTGKVKGSAGVPLVPMASIASDRSLIPSGSVVLVEVPQIDRKGNWTGEHKLHLMIALDVGGAVKGHHFDLYRGIGDEAGHIAGLSKHYGRVWLLK
ncbi:murein transglycosylase A [Avibacterium avium]|uniref:murein transglycosylase A n=1 Tax=Avibacterium avium TaxID=751 RepID=UPI003BF782F1